MQKRIIDLTQLMVNQGIDSVLSSDSYSCCQTVFKDTDLRNKLALYALRQAPSHYIAIGLDQPDELRNKVFLQALQQRQRIKALIHEGIHYLLPKDSSQLIYFSANPESTHPISRDLPKRFAADTDSQAA